MRLRVGFPVSSCSPLYLRRHAKPAPGICEGAHDRARLLPRGYADVSQDRHPTVSAILAPLTPTALAPQSWCRARCETLRSPQMTFPATRVVHPTSTEPVAQITADVIKPQLSSAQAPDQWGSTPELSHARASEDQKMNCGLRSGWSARRVGAERRAQISSGGTASAGASDDGFRK
jgi:hypothetical protein